MAELGIRGVFVRGYDVEEVAPGSIDFECICTWPRTHARSGQASPPCCTGTPQAHGHTRWWRPALLHVLLAAQVPRESARHQISGDPRTRLRILRCSTISVLPAVLRC